MQVNTRLIILLTLTVLAWLPVRAQQPDSSRIPAPSDSAGTPLPGEDTLTAAQRALARFEQRYKDFQEEKKQRLPALSYYDSLVAYYTSGRQDTRERVDRSFYHDAGDYFRSEPSFFVLDHQATPMRKTVQPFGLSGDRLNLIVNGIPFEPFEHIIEPDGMRDLNDMPTALDDEIYVLPGGAGLLFGGRHAVASLLTRPRRPQSSTPETAIIHDRGSFAYNYTRGRYSRVFESGRTIDMSIGYRNALGLTNNREDDSYHYYGDIYFPVKPDVAIAANGQLYDRGGSFVVRPERNGRAVFRDKFDRNLTTSLDVHNADNTARSQFGYRHARQGSNISNLYRAWYNLTAHDVFMNREWIKGQTLFRMQAEGGFLRYDNGYDEFDRFSGQASLSLARLSPGLRYALMLGTRWVEDYDFLPTAAVVLFRETEKTFFQLSVGYCERAPHLYELHLPFERAAVYDSADGEYANVGNPKTKKERQLVGSLTAQMGTVANNVGVSVTGGRIYDGIDWQNGQLTDSAGLYTLFSPANGDIEFVNVAGGPTVSITDFLRFSAGGAYHHVDYRQFDKKPYLPDYQLFSGLELHVYWRQRLLHLYAYGEIVYSGGYDGYVQTGLGNDPVANVKISFRIKKFRMHYVVQNALNREYTSRDYITFPGRYNYYGITWNFGD